MEDTIVAIATTVGISAINIIRISGSDSFNIVNKIFKGKNLKKVKSHTINYGHIIDENEIVDEVLVSVFKAPKTYTKEDIVEINSHGGISSTKKILDLLLENGARLAEPGEFAKRAFLNGRIDLIEAESIQDLINAKSENARKISIKGISGEVSTLIDVLRNKIKKVLANIEVNIDYPEYEDALDYTNQKLKKEIRIIKKEINDILEKSKNGRIIKNGINVAIIGKPNVGKSSLLNVLLNEDKAIVTEIEGTTRDLVEGTILLNGTNINLIDTAGIRETEDIVENLGVRKSKEVIDKSDLILFVIDAEKGATSEDYNLYNEIKNTPHIIVFNKIDSSLKKPKNFEKVKNIEISAKNNLGIDKIKEEIIRMFNLKEIESGDYTYLSNSRQLALLSDCKIIVEEIEKGIVDNQEIDIIEIDLKRLWDKLGEITGQTYKEELLDELFSSFCLGK